MAYVEKRLLLRQYVTYVEQDLRSVGAYIGRGVTQRHLLALLGCNVEVVYAAGLGATPSCTISHSKAYGFRSVKKFSLYTSTLPEARSTGEVQID